MSGVTRTDDEQATTRRSGAHRVPGEDARTPSDVPARGWFQIARRAWREAKADQVPLLAAGVAFYAFLSLFPALVALVMLYGLVADPDEVRDQIESLASALPSSARELLTGQLETLASQPQQSLGIGLAVAVGAALWSASSGVGHLMTAINAAYDEDETRGFVKRKALALVMTLGAIVFFVVTLGLVAALPAVLGAIGLSSGVVILVQVVRWLMLVGVVTVALAVLYRYAADRDSPRMTWVSVGAVIATVLWVLASIGFSLYVENFGSYGETYGALAGVVVLLLWLWITCYAVLLGAEANAEAEQQTARDTTIGRERPMGQRRAVKADTPPGGQGDTGPAPGS